LEREVFKTNKKIKIQTLEDKSTGDTGHTNRAKMKAIERDMNQYFKHINEQKDDNKKNKLMDNIVENKDVHKANESDDDQVEENERYGL